MVIDFLRWVWPDFPGIGEFRGIPTREEAEGALRPPILRSWVDIVRMHRLEPGEDHMIVEAVAEVAVENRDVYFGVLPRFRIGGTAADVVGSTNILWADVDAKMHNHSKTEALKALLAVSPAPQVVVDSGGGYHGYWKTGVFIATSHAREMMKGIAAACGGDHTYDAPRVLRLPGTLNHKYHGWPQSRVIRFDRKTLYRPADFEDFIPREQPRREYPTYAPGEHRALDQWLVDLINSSPPKGERSEAAFKAALWLYRFGYSPEEIEQIFETAPIGEKYREEGNGSRWLRLVLTKYS